MKSNNYLGKHDENRGIVIFCIILLIILAGIGGIVLINKYSTPKDMIGAKSIDDISSYIQKQECDINKFEIDKNKLILQGELKESVNESILSKLRNIEIVFKNKDGDKYEYSTDYFITNEGIDFSSIDENSKESKINLDELEQGEYFVFLRLKYESSKTDSGYRYRYYTLKNSTEVNEQNYNNIKLLFNSSSKVSSYLTIIYN